MWLTAREPWIFFPFSSGCTNHMEFVGGKGHKILGNNCDHNI